MKTYIITVSGCDDSTEVTVALNEHDARMIGRLAAQITNGSEYVCMPTMEIREAREGTRG